MSLLHSLSNPESIKKNPIRVNVRLMFQRIGEIDTLNEKYQAHVSIEARWLIDVNDLLPNLCLNDQNQLTTGKSITMIEYKNNLHPHLFIENALGDLKEQIRYTAKIMLNDKVCICEHRDIKGSFWEKLELHHFPSDVQELTISIGSMLYDDQVILIPDSFYSSGINREAFFDQQEWSLYEHVDTEQRFIKEFFHNDNDEDNDQYEFNEERKRSIVSISCHAARRSAYFYWNAYFLIFLITICAFCIFAMPPNLPQNRLQTSATLLLTSITFRWTVNRSLPTISYLTSLDKYSIISIFILIILCGWHSIIGVIIFIEKRLLITEPNDRNSWIDRVATATVCHNGGPPMLMHIIMFIWLYKVPLSHRREMKQKSLKYKRNIHQETNDEQLLNDYLLDNSSSRTNN